MIFECGLVWRVLGRGGGLGRNKAEIYWKAVSHSCDSEVHERERKEKKKSYLAMTRRWSACPLLGFMFNKSLSSDVTNKSQPLFRICSKNDSCLDKVT